MRLGELEEKFDITVVFKDQIEEIAVRKMEKLNEKKGKKH